MKWKLLGCEFCGRNETRSCWRKRVGTERQLVVELFELSISIWMHRSKPLIFQWRTLVRVEIFQKRCGSNNLTLLFRSKLSNKFKQNQNVFWFLASLQCVDHGTKCYISQGFGSNLQLFTPEKPGDGRKLRPKGRKIGQNQEKEKNFDHWIEFFLFQKFFLTDWIQKIFKVLKIVHLGRKYLDGFFEAEAFPFLQVM